MELRTVSASSLCRRHNSIMLYVTHAVENKNYMCIYVCVWLPDCHMLLSFFFVTPAIVTVPIPRLAGRYNIDGTY
jgi:hypothetical protein